jgi:hypothetical protein
MDAVHSGQRRAATGMLMVHSGQFRSVAAWLRSNSFKAAAHRYHDHEVHHGRGDREGEHLGQEGAVGEPRPVDGEHHAVEGRLPADQRQ